MRQRAFFRLATAVVLLMLGCNNAAPDLDPSQPSPMISTAPVSTPSGATSIPSFPACSPVRAPTGALITQRAIDLGPLHPWELTADDEGRLWILSRDYATFKAATVTRFDPETNTLGSPIALGTDAWDMTTGGGAVWIATNNPGGRVLRVDGDLMVVAGEVASDWPLGMSLVAGLGYLWTADDGFDAGEPSFVTQIDMATRIPVRRVEVGLSPQSIGIGDGSVWTGNHADLTVSRVDPAGGRPSEATLIIGSPHEVFGGEAALWIAASHEARLVRLDFGSGEPSPVCLPFNPLAMAMAPDGSIWVASSKFDEAAQDEELAVVDDRTGQLRRIERVGARPIALAMSHGSLWILTHEPNRLVEVELTGSAAR